MSKTPRRQRPKLIPRRDAVGDQARIQPSFYSISTIHRVLTTRRRYGGLGYSLKLLTRLAVQAYREERRIYLDCLRQVDDLRQFVFIDESTGGRNEGRRRRGWGALGVEVPEYYSMRFSRETKRCRSTEEDIHGDRCRGHRRLRPRCVRRRVPKVWNTDTSPDCGTVDTERFLQYVNDRLIPTLALRALGEPRRIVSCYHRQRQYSQRCTHPKRHRGCGRRRDLDGCVLPRSEPDRALFCAVQEGADPTASSVQREPARYAPVCVGEFKLRLAKNHVQPIHAAALEHLMVQFAPSLMRT